MDSVIKYVVGFFGGLMSIMMAVLPVTILWQLLTGSMVFDMDIIGNFASMVNTIGGTGFLGLLTLVFVMYFFVKK